jgi:sec-independent protein translocase protein TatB
MIDLGLSKLAVIGVVALVVIGPERLPKVARMAGSLFGRAQRYIQDVKSEVSREIELDELRKMQAEVKGAARDVEQSISQGVSEVESTVQSAWRESDDAYTSLPPLQEARDEEQYAVKAKDFRRKKLRASALPSWYKKQTGQKTRITSGAARVARFRPAGAKRKSAAFFQ